MFVEIFEVARQAHSLEDLIELIAHLKLENLDPRDDKPPYLTPAGKLAWFGFDKSAELLRQLGAAVLPIIQGYAMANNHRKIEEYRTEHLADVNTIAEGYVFAGNHDKVEEYRREHQASVDNIAGAYVFAGNHDKVEEYRTKHQASVHKIAENYVLADNDDKVEEYRTMHQASVDSIAEAYAFADNDHKVEEYRRDHQVSVGAIAKGYAIAGNHGKVEEYRREHHASVDAIAEGYAIAGNHAKVEEYRTEYQADVLAITEGYFKENQPIPEFYQAINTLTKHGAVGNTVIKVMNRLKIGQDSQWNPYWINSNVKLERIIQAVRTLEGDSDLSSIINNEASALYQALNMQRLLPLTFLGQFAINKAKSLLAVTDEMINSGPENPTF